MHKLTSQAARVAFILHTIQAIQDAKPAQALAFAKAQIDTELQAAPYRKPCMVEGRSFDSVIEGATWLAHNRRHLWIHSRAAQRQDAYAVMKNLQTRISRYCTADNVTGYFWI